jgi:hypothetical protein
MEEQYEDGNVLAGPMREIFAVDVTAATGRCATGWCCVWSGDPAQRGSTCEAR